MASVVFSSSTSQAFSVYSPQETKGKPSKEQAQRTFWGLGDRFWMQMIDGKYHQYGPMVFDEALHKGSKEPGFFASLKKGCEFAAEHLGEKLTVVFYKQLHKELCSHFKGEENNTQMTADKAGSFREEYSRARYGFQLLNEKAREHYLNLKLYDWCFDESKQDGEISTEIGYCINTFRRDYSFSVEWAEEKKNDWNSQTGINEKLKTGYQNSRKWVEEYELQIGEKVEKLNAYMSDICKHLSVKRFASFDIIDKILYVNYNRFKPEENEQIIQMLFDRYNQQIEEINLKLSKTYKEDDVQLLIEEKVSAISDLFQLLEWLHPFLDGQGRTDLVLQAKLLSEEGSNPAILKEPYTSTTSTPQEWKADLSKGIECWKEEQAK